MPSKHMDINPIKCLIKTKCILSLQKFLIIEKEQPECPSMVEQLNVSSVLWHTVKSIKIVVQAFICRQLCIYLERAPRCALSGVAQWIECWTMKQKVTGLISSEGTYLSCSPGFLGGGSVTGNHTLMFLSLPLCLKINKILKKKKLKELQDVLLSEEKQVVGRLI